MLTDNALTSKRYAQPCKGVATQLYAASKRNHQPSVLVESAVVISEDVVTSCDVVKASVTTISVVAMSDVAVASRGVDRSSVVADCATVVSG